MCTPAAVITLTLLACRAPCDVRLGEFYLAKTCSAEAESMPMSRCDSRSFSSHRGARRPTLVVSQLQLMSGCPVKRSPDESSGRTYAQYWGGWLGGATPSSPSSPTSSSADTCPVVDKPMYNPLTNDVVFGHEKQPHQTKDLRTSRAVSSIPKVSCMLACLWCG